MKNKVFTKTNLILSAVTIVLFMIKFFELLYLDTYYNIRGTYVWGDIALGILIFLIYTIIFAYLSRLIGIKKGIESGYILGLCLGIIGFIVVCALKEEPTDNSANITKNNKYDEIEKLQNLKIKGILTDEEFEKEKQKLLN